MYYWQNGVKYAAPDPTAEELKKQQDDQRRYEEYLKKTQPKTDRQFIEELQTKQEDLTLRQEDIELMIADAIGGAI